MRQAVTRSWPVGRGVVLRADATADSGSRRIGGVAVPFGQPTRIDNPYEGRFDEQFTRGAFRRTLAERTPVLQYDHGTHPSLGSLPLGRFERLEETRRGLEFDAELIDDPFVDPVLAAIRAGLLGMSIRFRALRTVDTVRPNGVDLQTITEAELIELGPVVFPAYTGTSVEARASKYPNDRARRARYYALRSK